MIKALVAMEMTAQVAMVVQQGSHSTPDQAIAMETGMVEVDGTARLT